MYFPNTLSQVCGDPLTFSHAQIVDNVVRDGQVANPEDTDSRIEGVRRLLEMIKTDPEVSATAISTVGEKGYDGFAFVLKL